jgi:hypothetical protein
MLLLFCLKCWRGVEREGLQEKEREWNAIVIEKIEIQMIIEEMKRDLTPMYKKKSISP